MIPPTHDTRSVSPPILEAERLVRHFRTRRKLPWGESSADVVAVDGIDLQVIAGETLSLVGESGCGKSTTAKLLLGLDAPTHGRVLFRGHDLATGDRSTHRRYRREVQAVFQDPTSSLNPKRRVSQLIAEPLRLQLGLTRSAAQEEIIELLLRVNLDPEVRHAFPHELSGGMAQRVAVAQALSTKPSVVVLDEPVSALDVSIRAQVMNLLKDVQASEDVAFLLIAHDLATVRYLSHAVAAMYLGTIVEKAPAAQLFGDPLHPYTLALLSAASGSVSPGRQRIVLRGDVPSPTDVPTGCRFRTRCWLKSELGDPAACTDQEPATVTVGPEHLVACHFVDESRDHPTRRHLVDQLKTAAPGRPASSGNKITRTSTP